MISSFSALARPLSIILDRAVQVNKVFLDALVSNIKARPVQNPAMGAHILSILLFSSASSTLQLRHLLTMRRIRHKTNLYTEFKRAAKRANLADAMTLELSNTVLNAFSALALKIAGSICKRVLAPYPQQKLRMNALIVFSTQEQLCSQQEVL